MNCHKAGHRTVRLFYGETCTRCGLLYRYNRVSDKWEFVPWPIPKKESNGETRRIKPRTKPEKERPLPTRDDQMS